MKHNKRKKAEKSKKGSAGKEIVDDKNLDNFYKQKFAELEESTWLYRGLFEQTNDGLFIISLDGHYLRVNKRAAEMLGYTVQELEGRSSYEFIAPIDLEKSRKKHLHILEGKPVPLYERVFRKKDGSFFYGEINISLVYDKAGHPSYIQSAVRDITDRKKFEEALLRQADAIAQQKLQAEASEKEKLEILNAFTEIVVYYEEGATIKWANKAAGDSLGMSQEELIGKKCHPLWGESEAICEGCPVQKARSTRKVENFERETPDGRIWRIWGIPIIRDGKLKALVEIARNITKERQDEEELKKLYQDLEDRVRERTAQLATANDELEAFSYSVSHDLRAPLRRINSFAKLQKQVLQKEEKINEKALSYIDRIIGSTMEMNELIDGMLSFSRLIRVDMVRRSIDLNVLVNNLIDQMKIELGSRKIHWELKPLPEIYADLSLIRVVFSNIISNALKFTKEREEAVIEIGHELDPTKKFDIIYVKDNGVGFDMKYVDKVFTVFQRLHGAKFEGSGIGLATVQRIIHRHGGTVGAEGKEGQGAKIFFSLPRKKSVKR